MRALWLMLLAAPLAAQVPNPSIVLVSTAPSGSCTGGLPDQQVITTGVIYSCQNSTWTAFTSGASTSSVPANLQFLGDGSDGAFTCPSGTCTITNGEHWYSSFNISAGAILNPAGTGSSAVATIVRSTGPCTVSGTWNFNGVAFNSNWGGAAGGGGGGAASGAAGNSTFANLGGGGGGTAGNPGSNGAAWGNAAPLQKFLLGGTAMNETGNVISGVINFGGGQGGAGGSSGGSAGLGGGMIVLDCASITLANTAVISVTGGNGSASAANSTGAGGAGGGGVFIARAPSLTNNGATINVTGGQGGNCYNPAIVLSVPTSGGQTNSNTTWGSAHVSTFAGGNPTVVTVDNAGSGYNFTPNCAVVGTGGGANTGSGATCTVTMTGSGSSQTISSIAVTGGNAGYGTGTTYTSCGKGGDGASGWTYVLAK